MVNFSLCDFHLNKTKTVKFHGYPEDFIPSAAHPQREVSGEYKGIEWESLVQHPLMEM